MRDSSLTQRWRSGGKTGGCRDDPDFQRPSQKMSYILLAIGQEGFALSPEAQGKDPWLAPS